jgi:hypothetical protein
MSPAGIPVNEVLFPPVDAAGKVRLQRFLKTVVEEFMDAEIKVDEVTIIRAIPEEGRADVRLILSKVAANEKNKKPKAEPAK